MAIRISPVPLIVIALVACTPRGQVRIDPAAASLGDVRPVFVGTSRGYDAATGDEYGRIRSESARYGRLDVSVPPQREPGTVAWPKKNRAANPSTEFVLAAETYFSAPSEFRASLSRALTAKPRGQREAVVFVHGFNTTFAEGVYRTAQLGHDLDLPGVLVHYSWPSRAQPLAYVYDRDSALFSRDSFESLLRDVAASGADSIVIVAHSMGSALTMETLRQMAIAGDQTVRPKIDAVVLMSPDLDVDVFRAQARRIGTLPQPFIIFTSQKDRALTLAARLSGEDSRLGNLQDVSRVADLDVTMIEVGAFSEGGAGHFTAGSSPLLLKLLGRLGDVDKAFSKDQAGRTGLLPGVILTVQEATQIVLLPVNAVAGAGR